MQRKRNRVHYADTIESGTNLIPVSRGLMRKLKMKSFLKYAIVGIICFTVFSLYEKVMVLSKDSIPDAAEIWNKGNEFVKSFNNNRHTQVDSDRADINQSIDRRVKEEINKVFQDFKEKQDRAEQDARLNPWNDRQENQVNDIPIRNQEPEQFADQGIWNEWQNNRFKKNDDSDKFNIRQDANDVVEMMENNFVDNGNMYNDDNQIMENPEENKGEDMGDHFEEVMDNVMDIINEDQEKEEIQLEDEIEHRLAEVLKDAVNEVADEQAEQNQALQIDGNVEDVDAFNRALEPEQMYIPEQKEFNVAVDQMGAKLNPLEMNRLNERAFRDEQKKDEDHEFPPFVTAAGSHTYQQVTQLVASLQGHMPGKKIYIYDLDLTTDQKKHLMSYCGVRMRNFMKELFPEYVKNFASYYWKPLVIQTALAEFGHLTWINPQYRLITPNIGPILHESHDTGILLIGQFASYSTYSATNPKMFDFIPSNKDRLANSPHIEIRAMVIHNTPEVHENVMKLFTACALEQNCLAPPGSKWTCTFDFTGKKPAGCHRYDESAMNILLKNWFDFDLNKFAKRNSYFRDYDQHYKPNLKLCRSVRDIRDSEL